MSHIFSQFKQAVMFRQVWEKVQSSCVELFSQDSNKNYGQIAVFTLDSLFQNLPNYSASSAVSRVEKHGVFAAEPMFSAQ